MSKSDYGRVRWVHWVGFPVLVLALGHTLSNLLRTMPAVAADVLADDLLISTGAVASLAGAYHFAFAAGQIPVGIALDRYGVRNVSLVMLAGVTLGTLMATLISGPLGFLMVQIVLGLACCGMLLAPMTLLAKTMPANKFASWSGLVHGIGNAGMLISASPLAWLIEHYGWRSSFVLSAGIAVLLGVGVYAWVPRIPENLRSARGASLLQEAREVIRIGISPSLRAVVMLALMAFASIISIRGLWGGPWLMELQGLDRVQAGQAMLPMTVALVLGPICYGALVRRVGHAAHFLLFGFSIGGLALLIMALSQTPLWAWLGGTATSSHFDVGMFLLFGIAMGCTPLLFVMARAQINAGQAGKALAAVNLVFFVGAAVLQSSTGPVAEWGGIPAVFAYVGVMMWIAVSYFAYRVWWRRA
ncbi:MFS transporter [Pusillimonas sp. CC-YST705]|uniref:MFS transporter n=1 Tax=Mesopusillimonas faecipullorum TaxID=2755040 RepID=A0ABS8CEP5_9BURK|nr:MFS transporter [Mesopusillimonas faecipullorum]MCB5364510.1 MFS transporter [Mesopusillimonas faecipullorum]